MLLHSLDSRLRQCAAGDPRYVEPQASFAVASTGSPICASDRCQFDRSGSSFASNLKIVYILCALPVAIFWIGRNGTAPLSASVSQSFGQYTNLSDSCGGQVCSPD